MKLNKKITAVAMAMMMAVSTMAMSASADSGESQTSTKSNQYIELIAYNHAYISAYARSRTTNKVGGTRIIVANVEIMTSNDVIASYDSNETTGTLKGSYSQAVTTYSGDLLKYVSYSSHHGVLYNGTTYVSGKLSTINTTLDFLAD